LRKHIGRHNARIANWSNTALAPPSARSKQRQLLVSTDLPGALGRAAKRAPEAVNRRTTLGASNQQGSVTDLGSAFGINALSATVTNSTLQN
jgi:hypothetical protein